MKLALLPWEFKESPNNLQLGDLLTDEFREACEKYNRNKEKSKSLLEESYLPLIEKKYEEIRANRHFDDWKTGENIWRLMPAEVSSSIRITQKLETDPKDISVVLLVSDTAEAWLSSKFIENLLGNFGFKLKLEPILGYQMENMEELKSTGIQQFVQVIHKYSNGNKNSLFNITGGYKNFIPLITHIASFYQKDMYYAFEEVIANDTNDSLIRIPTVPTFNKVLADKNDVIIDIIFNLIDEDFYTLEDADSAIYDTIISIFEGLDDAAESYTNFVKSFFEFNQIKNKVTLTIIGKTYLELLKNKGD